MITVTPFRALRPAAQFAREVASKPYDVLSVKEAKTEAEGKPNSFLHITRSEIDLPKNTDVHSAEVYAKAKENLEAFISREVLFREQKPCYYIYELIMDGRSQTGLVCCSSVNDYEEGRIKKHEFTRPEKEQDRINHIFTTKAQTGNVFLAYRDIEELTDMIEKWKSSKSSVYNFTSEDGISHSVWVISNDKLIERITALFKEEISCTYIADGHHRIASAAKVKKMLSGKKNARYFLSTLFPASELKVYDYNRVIKDLNGMSTGEYLEKIRKILTVTEMNQAYKPEAPHHFGMYLDSRWYRLIAPDNIIGDDPVGVLDVSVLQKNVLEPLFGIKDQRTDPRIDFVGGIRGMNELHKRVDNGEAAVAFSVFPVTMDQLFNIADNNLIMPPKSTWFEPKLRDGLLTHLLSE